MEHVIDDAAEYGLMQLQQQMQQVNATVTQAIYMVQQMRLLKASPAVINSDKLSSQREELRIKLNHLQDALKPVLNTPNPTSPAPMTAAEAAAIKDVNDGLKHDVNAYVKSAKNQSSINKPTVVNAKEVSMGR